MDYFIIVNGKQQGPYSPAELASRHITSETLVWAEGMAQWTPAWEVDELKSVLRGDAPAAPTPPLPNGATATPAEGQSAAASAADPTANAASPTANSAAYSANGATDSAHSTTPAGPQPPQGQPAGQRKRRRGLIALIVLLVVVVLMAISNPDRRDHEEAIGRELTGAMTSAVDSLGFGDDPFFATITSLGKAMAGRIVADAVGSVLQVHNYVVCSRGTVDYGGKTYTVSFGLLGHVWTMNQKEIEEAVEKQGNVEVDKMVRRRVGQGVDAVRQAADSLAGQAIGAATDEMRRAARDMQQDLDQEIDRSVNEAVDSVDVSTVSRIITDIKRALGL